jgi:tetratricopeptide (TPR) repeat protein
MRLETDQGLTQTGMAVGTPRYMAPEQTTGGRAGITVATHVYGLGGVLYFLLTGRPPFDADNSGDLVKKVMHEQPQPPRQVNGQVDRDLETICLKCLEKEPRQRYPSALALAEDLERWLAGKPITARPVGRLERLWRWCRRNPMPAALVVVIAFTVLAAAGGGVAFWYQRREADQQRAAAENERRRAERYFRQARDFDRTMARLGDGLASVPHMTARRRELLEQVLGSYEGFVAEEPDDPGLRQDLGESLLRMGDIQNELGRLEDAEVAYGRAQAVYEKLSAESLERPEYLQGLARSHEGPDANTLDRPDAKAEGCRRAVGIRKALADQHPEQPRYRDELAKTYNTFAAALWPAGRLQDARDAIQEALRLARALRREQPGEDAYKERLGGILVLAGRLADEAGKRAEAGDHLEGAVTILKDLVARSPGERRYRQALVGSYYFLGGHLLKSGRPHEAEKAWRRALEVAAKLAADFPSVAEYQFWKPTILRSYGNLLEATQRWPQAEKPYGDTVAAYDQLSKEFPTRLWNRMSRINMSQAYGP